MNARHLLETRLEGTAQKNMPSHSMRDTHYPLD